MHPLDEPLFRLVNGLTGSPAVDVFAVFAAQALIFLLAVAIVWAALAGKEGDRLMGGMLVLRRAALACAAGIVGNVVISLAYFRPRPFVTLRHVHLLVAPPLTAKSFPSDHATLAFAMAWSVYLVRPKAGMVMFALAAVVAFGRVLVGVHYPGDVFAGAIVGVTWAFVASRIVRPKPEPATP